MKHNPELTSPAFNRPTDRPTGRGGFISRFVAGLLGGYLLATTCAGLCMLAIVDFMAREQNPAAGLIAGSIFIGILSGSVVFALRSERAAKVWRRLLLLTAACALATPLFVAAALIMAAIRGQDLGMGAIVLFYLGGGGVFGGVLLWLIGRRIGR